MRSYIRHPADIPIQVETPASSQDDGMRKISNISRGGLAFDSVVEMPKGKVVRLHIAIIQPEFEAEGVVTHCSPEGDHFVVGIEFINHDDLYVARMVEQICHIEHYKKEIAEREGRYLSGQEAAREWIEKYAASFPQWTN